MPLRRLTAALALLVAVHAGWIVSTGLADAPRAADVAVVLGTTALPDGRLSDRLEARTSAALALYRDGLVRRVLVSGATGSEGVNEAEAMASWLVAEGVPRRHVLVDPAGFNTWATAQNTRTILEREGLSTVVAVSSYYHLARTELALERAGVDVVGTRRAPMRWEPRELWSIAREIPALYVYTFRGV